MRNKGFAMFLVIIAGFLGGTIVSVLAGSDSEPETTKFSEKKDEAHVDAKAESSPKPEGSSKPGMVSKNAKVDETSDTALVGLAEELKKRREELNTREKELATRERELKSREDALTDELAKLKDMREQLSIVTAARSQQNEEKISKVVETLETMNPKTASKMISSMDEALAVSAMTRISTQKLAKILNVMDSGRSIRLTELMAGVVRARTGSASSAALASASKGAAVSTNNEKGGENYDQSSEQQRVSVANNGKNPDNGEKGSKSSE